ncbi:aldo/keto reductase [Methanospirillum stamsii]|uniref:Aldo/keto reductase n=1 Tax=Methanospirillum stamsii TaxID=1277351 RepID=A0A2V2MUM4_9EURY|nr:aldo/keto reductase [Methanospirillum stamsii]PWR69885.1 aldo/keto reductase [Methanospirillum stamsii]
MQYRTVPKNGDSLSALGFGAMRLPTRRGHVDEERATRLIRTAIDQGVNYLDTAFSYHGGESEKILGRILKDGYREKVKLATKLPPWNVHTREDMDKVLSIQLKRLQTENIDYYLLHSLNAASWKKFTDLGVFEFLESARDAGLITNIGFSFHGDRKTFREIIDAYDWTFCQIQYNFLDEENQAGKEGLLYAASKNVAVMVMEPLRGGSLAGKIPKEARNHYERSGRPWSAAAWGLSYVWNHPEVTVVLSGMNDEAHLAENIAICEMATPGFLSGKDIGVINDVRDSFLQKMKIGCTGCSYCMPCPFGVNIPMCFYYYNQYHMLEEKIMTRGFYSLQLMGGMGSPAHASLCRECGRCVSNCPQNIDIPKELKNVSKTMDGWQTKLVFMVAKRMFGTNVKDE